MAAPETIDAKQQRHTDILRSNAEDIAETFEDLADDIEAGEAEPADVARAVREVAGSLVAVEDAADGLIDADEARWRALDNLRASAYHGATAICLDECDRETLGPTARSSRSEAISSAIAAAEYLEAARDE
jgi:hypothetical protein